MLPGESALFAYLRRWDRAGEVLTFVAELDQVLGDNQTVFFPEYTDHGQTHVREVLHDVFRLLPHTMREAVAADEPSALTPADAAALVAATWVHDAALHIRPTGLTELISGAWGGIGIPKFRSALRDYPADAAWPELWTSYLTELRHTPSNQLRAAGLSSDGSAPKVVLEPTLPADDWNSEDRRVAGEFIRRHHPRIAQEIVSHGIPGLGPNNRSSDAFWDVVGLIARSHGEDLRFHSDYLAWQWNRSPEQAGVRGLYCMALLRVADALQVHRSRAPRLLLRLREPLPSRSLSEWQKHAAVESVVWDQDDREAVQVQASADHALSIHLELKRLIAAIQTEMDVSTAVLSEVLGPKGLHELSLSKRRIISNLDSPWLLDKLPYYPLEARLKSRADLSHLLVDRLYGRDAAIAGRELLQNAVDAVRARPSLESESPPMPSVQVSISVDPGAKSGSFVIRDRGVGMSPTTVAEYFMSSGASYRPDLGKDGLKAGYFGIGALAAFLLGDRVYVKTRAVGAAHGCRFELRAGSEPVELTRCDCEVGTIIEIPFTRESLGNYDAAALANAIGYYYWLSEPVVAIEYTDEQGTHAATTGLERGGPQQHPGAWLATQTADIGIEVTVPKEPSRDVVVVHNGIRIRDADVTKTALSWASDEHRRALHVPALRYTDPRHRLELALDRSRLMDDCIPCENEILHLVGLDLVAHALVSRSAHPLFRNPSPDAVFSSEGWLPPLRDLVRRYVRGDALTMSLPTSQTGPAALQFDPFACGFDWYAVHNRGTSASAEFDFPGARATEQASAVLARIGGRTGSVHIGEFDGRAMLASFTPPPRRLAELSPDAARALERDSLRLRVGVENVWRKLIESASTAARLPDFVRAQAIPAETSGEVSSIARPWVELIRGPMPYDDASRERLLEYVLEAHPDLETRVAFWRFARP